MKNKPIKEIDVECPVRNKEQYKELVSKFNEYLKGDVRKEDLESLKFILKQVVEYFIPNSKGEDPRDPNGDAYYGIIKNKKTGNEYAYFEAWSYKGKNDSISVSYHYNYPKFLINKVSYPMGFGGPVIEIPVELFKGGILRFFMRVISEILREEYNSRNPYTVVLVTIVK